MKILVTGSAGHLGEALVRTLRARGDDVVGLDRLPSPFTDACGSIVDRAFVADAMRVIAGSNAVVLHAATLHKPHVATHARQDFIDVNITGTHNLLEEAVANEVGAFVFTSTTSAFGDALVPKTGAPATWITEDTVPRVKNVYGATKVAAEDLCELMHRLFGLPCLVLRTSRFFPEEDDQPERRDAHADDALKVSELLHRRVDLDDVVDAHLAAVGRASSIGFARYVVSATSPFTRDDLADLTRDAASVVRRRVPAYEAVYRERGWTLPSTIDRVYVNDRARADLGWTPRLDFATAIDRLARGADWRGPLASVVGTKGYHRTA